MNINQEEINIFRVIDANLNRLKEGIRVVEDINRYIFNDKNTSSELKKIRHRVKIQSEIYQKLLDSRDSRKDVLKATLKEENKRESIFDILKANYRRATESSRVLEEIYKIEDLNLSEEFKSIRYDLYSIEKDNFENFKNIRS